MTPKALSAEEMEAHLDAMERAGFVVVVSELRAHIAALEADNAEAIRLGAVGTYERDELAREVAQRGAREESAIAAMASAGAECEHGLVAGVASLLERHEKEVVALRAYVEAFVETAEAAVRNQETKGHGGQHVSFHGDFSCIQPSVTSRLRWWAREGREALAGKASGLLVRTRNEGLRRAVLALEGMKDAAMEFGHEEKAKAYAAAMAYVGAMKEPEQ